MTAKPRSSVVRDADAAFHAVQWVREMRDQMYAVTSTLSAAELIAFVREAATASNADPRVAESGSDGAGSIARDVRRADEGVGCWPRSSPGSRRAPPRFSPTEALRRLRAAKPLGRYTSPGHREREVVSGGGADFKHGISSHRSRPIDRRAAPRAHRTGLGFAAAWGRCSAAERRRTRRDRGTPSGCVPCTPSCRRASDLAFSFPRKRSS